MNLLHRLPIRATDSPREAGVHPPVVGANSSPQARVIAGPRRFFHCSNSLARRAYSARTAANTLASIAATAVSAHS